MTQPLSLLSDGVQLWEARNNLGDEMYALATHVLYAQAMLHIASRMETENPSLHALLLQLQLLVHNADVVLNELDYFRVQDELNCTSHAADVRPKGCIHRLHFHACHTVRAAAAKLKPFSSSRDLASINLSSACCVGNERQVQGVKTPKPKFSTVLLSTKMTDIVEKLKPVSALIKTLI